MRIRQQLKCWSASSPSWDWNGFLELCLYVTPLPGVSVIVYRFIFLWWFIPSISPHLQVDYVCDWCLGFSRHLPIRIYPIYLHWKMLVSCTKNIVAFLFLCKIRNEGFSGLLYLFQFDNLTSDMVNEYCLFDYPSPCFVTRLAWLQVIS